MSRPGIEPGPPAWEASTLEKSHLDSLFASYSEHYYYTTNTNIPGHHSKPSAPPIIIIKLCSPQIRLAILRHKKLNTPAPSSADRAAGCKGFFISEDITQPTAKLLKELNDDDRVERAWTVEGRIRFIRAGDKDRRIVKVKSVFDSISTILGPSV
jgi:hypothetical protein